eukprot:NODE_37_length_31305_cov_0.348939.p10 type:complete len:200 gc:universal NODE_37_length_31305_cov_0.348939:7615-8214(+)
MTDSDVWFIAEIGLHILILSTLIGYFTYSYPLPELSWQLLGYYTTAMGLHLLIVVFPSHPVTSFYHFPRYYQLYCFGHVAHRFALFNLKYWMPKSWEVRAIVLILIGNFSCVTFDTAGIDISGGWFVFNMSINAITQIKIKNRFMYPVFINYLMSLTMVVLYYTNWPKFYVFWYLNYTAFVIMRIESAKLEKDGTPLVT